ncbi:unnamed protein product [Caenorhabditis sp. 36 PRJEB53466]|nr:unnamed protein product [Caenorhabditis sp. 36 PRJEB53466]
MSGPYQRPSNGSNILEQHAMRPATTADPSNCVVNDQESSINGILHNDSIQMQQQNMMGMQKNSMQQNQMVSNNVIKAGTSQRLPPLTLNTNKLGSNSVRSQNIGNQSIMRSGAMQMERAQQPQQLAQRTYDQTTTCQNKGPSMTMKEQLFGQQSLNLQPMGQPPRMNTPVLGQQHIGQQNMQQPQHVVYQQNPQTQNSNVNQLNQTGLMQQQQTSNNHLSMSQSQIQTGNRMMSSSYQMSQTPEQMHHLSHMDPSPTQHFMNSNLQVQMPQHSSQMNSSSNQMGGQSQVQSPSNISSASSTGSPARLPSLTFGNINSQTVGQAVSQGNIPMNASTTTQLLMALNNNSPITAEQLQEIQSMTCLAPDGTEMLLMQEPRLKQYSSLKEMSTNDLRIECKKRALSSTGTKVRLSERLADFEREVLDERNHQLLKEYTHRQQMYEAQAATLKAFQAKKAALQVQSCRAQNFEAQVVSSNEISSTTQPMSAIAEQTDGPPAKKKRITKSKKAQQQQEKQKGQVNTILDATEPLSTNTNNGGMVNLIEFGNNQPSMSLNSNGITQNDQTNTSSNIFGNLNQPGSGFFIKDNSCFSHLGSGCRIISANSSSVSSEDSQGNMFGSSGRVFQTSVPSGDNQVQYQQSEQHNFGLIDQTQVQSDGQNRPMSLNQQQTISNQNLNNIHREPINSNVTNVFNMPIQQQQQQQAQFIQQSQQNFMNSLPQNGLQGSPCVADQAGPSPNMPVSESTATLSESPAIVTSVTEHQSTDVAAELMDLETMQKLLSPATLRAREELLTQQQTKINELVKLIQKNHDTLREQQLQINLAKKQQKLRQRQNAPPIDKHVNTRCLQHAIKSRQDLTILNELTKQQDGLRTAETRLIEQLHINTATDDIARLIKQDGRTALVIVSLLHDYRTTREQNNRVKPTVDSPVSSDKAVELPKKKAPARKRNNNGSKVCVQNKKSPQQPDIEVVRVVQPQTNQTSSQQRNQQFLEFPQPQVQPRAKTQSDVDMEAIFKTVIDASRNSQPLKPVEAPQKPPPLDNEVMSLPSEGSSPTHAQSQNSVQSGYSDSYSTQGLMFQQDNSPQSLQYASNLINGNLSIESPDNLKNSTPNELIQNQLQRVLSKQSDELLSQMESNIMEHDLESHQFHDAILFSDDSNQGYVEHNIQNNGLDFDFPDIDQMVANIRESDPLDCQLDDIDLTAILDSWTDHCDTKQNGLHDIGQERDICDNMLFTQHDSMDQMGLQDDLNWNDFGAHSNIINQAFEQSQI